MQTWSVLMNRATGDSLLPAPFISDLFPQVTSGPAPSQSYRMAQHSKSFMALNYPLYCNTDCI